MGLSPLHTKLRPTAKTFLHIHPRSRSIGFDRHSIEPCHYVAEPTDPGLGVEGEKPTHLLGDQAIIEPSAFLFRVGGRKFLLPSPHGNSCCVELRQYILLCIALVTSEGFIGCWVQYLFQSSFHSNVWMRASKEKPSFAILFIDHWMPRWLTPRLLKRQNKKPAQRSLYRHSTPPIPVRVPCSVPLVVSNGPPTFQYRSYLVPLQAP